MKVGLGAIGSHRTNRAHFVILACRQVRYACRLSSSADVPRKAGQVPSSRPESHFADRHDFLEGWQAIGFSPALRLRRLRAQGMLLGNDAYPISRTVPSSYDPCNELAEILRGEVDVPITLDDARCLVAWRQTPAMGRPLEAAPVDLDDAVAGLCGAGRRGREGQRTAQAASQRAGGRSRHRSSAQGGRCGFGETLRNSGVSMCLPPSLPARGQGGVCRVWRSGSDGGKRRHCGQWRPADC